MSNTRSNILTEAAKNVCGDRQDDYGKPEDCFSDIAAHWTVHLRTRGILTEGASIQGFDVGVMMTFLKAVRAANKPSKQDNYVDGAGYFACAGECALLPVPEPGKQEQYTQGAGEPAGVTEYELSMMRPISDKPTRNDTNTKNQVHLVMTDGSIEPVIFNAAGFHFTTPPGHWAGWLPWDLLTPKKKVSEK
jgi:hypothetical protein